MVWMPSARPAASEHPDAKLVIRSLSPTSLELELHAADGVTYAPFGPIQLERQPDRFFRELFSEIEGLPARFGTSQEAHRELEDLGAEISKRLLPLELGRLLAQVRGREAPIRTLWVQSDEPWIPWELLRLPESADDRGFQGPFLGEAFDMARWLRVRPADGHLTPCRSLPLRRLAVVAPRDRRLDSVEGEVAFLERLGAGGRDVARIAADEDSVRQALADDRYDAWHFSGHGLPSDEPTRSEILFGANQCLRSRSLYAGLLAARRPLVFLNACHTGITGFSLTGIAGWAEGFLSAGAGAFIGAYWAIEDAPAARFTKVFYTAFLGGSPIAAALRQARLAIREEFPGDPTWLAYTLYAHPLAVSEDVEAAEPEETQISPPGRDERTRGRPVPQGARAQARPGLRRAALAAAILAAASLAIALGTRLWPAAAPSVLVLSPLNETGTSEEGWRALAVSELLTAALTFDGKLRTPPAATVHRRRLELGDVGLPSPAQMKRLHRQFGAPYLVHGALDVTFTEGGRFVEVALSLRRLPGGREEASVTLKERDERWPDLVLAAAEEFRRQLGAEALSAERRTRILRAFPAPPDALRLYVTGLGKLRTFDDREARRILSEAAAMAPEHPMIQASLAAAAENLGDLALAYEASQRAYDRRRDLPRRQELEIQASYHAIREDWPGATAVWRELREHFPHDPDYGFLLIWAQTLGAESPFAVIEDLSKTSLSASERVELEIMTGEARFAAGELEGALEAAERAGRSANDLGLRHQEARARLVQATVLETTGNLREAIDTLRTAQVLLQMEPEDRRGLQDVFHQLAIDVYRLEGIDAAREQFEILRRQYVEQGDQVGLATVQSSLGIVLTDFEAYAMAQAALEEALGIFSRLEMRHEVARVANSLGAVHHYQGRLLEARDFYLQSRRIAEDLGRRIDLAASLTNLGEIAFLEGDLEKARHLHEDARRLNRELGAVEGESYDLLRIGMVATVKGELADARKSLEEALGILDDIYPADLPQIHRAETRLALAEVKLLEENFGDARELARQAEQSFLKLDAAGRAILAQTVLVRTFFDQDLAQARAVVDRARQNAMTYRGEDRRVPIALAVAKGRLAALERDAAVLGEAVAELDRLAAEVPEVPYRLEIRLALAEAEAVAGRAEGRRPRLHEVLAEAKTMGFAVAAARAEKLLAASTPR